MTRGIAGRVLTAGAFKILRFPEGNGVVSPAGQGTFAPGPETEVGGQAAERPEGAGQKFMDDLSKDIQRMVSKRRICCLTRDPTSTLMWSHYAENHHGVCLEFGVDNDPSLRLCKFSMPRNIPCGFHMNSKPGKTGR